MDNFLILTLYYLSSRSHRIEYLLSPPLFLSGAVNPVKSQGICGSCYAYSVTGAMEGAYFIKVCRMFEREETESRQLF